MIFQEPMSALSPVHTIGNQIGEVLPLHAQARQEGGARARDRAAAPGRRSRAPSRLIDRYPFEFSGGMRQRVMIAMALACNPDVLIADEPTTALDVTTQAEILDLIQRLQVSRGMAMMLITHDMGVVAEIADDVAVMRDGEIVEMGPVDQIFHDPKHPYTQKLLAATRRLEQTVRAARRQPASGNIRTASSRSAGLTQDFRRHQDVVRAHAWSRWPSTMSTSTSTPARTLALSARAARERRPSGV